MTKRCNDIVTITDCVGVPGVPGEQGPPGIPGGTFYLHTQVTASSSWVIPHNLGYRGHTTLFTTSWEEIEADVVAGTTITSVTFASPQSGYAYIS